MPVQRTVTEWDAIFTSIMIAMRAAVGEQNFIGACRYVDQFHTELKDFMSSADDDCKESVMFKSYAMIIVMLAQASHGFTANGISPDSSPLEMADRAMLKLQLQKHEMAIVAMIGATE
jgi:hypothetical protein